eukprot:TRINITY_DN4787_c0_g1_i1.p1 TRINITY_DN4787_c0_g1~~TRINITY_DN4787_c0_g1_i1.p1  ORF type:complete len:383 (-),score=74.01 TRINITY_DN4787_c0_g1_i1:18-1166(-)
MKGRGGTVTSSTPKEKKDGGPPPLTTALSFGSLTTSKLKPRATTAIPASNNNPANASWSAKSNMVANQLSTEKGDNKTSSTPPKSVTISTGTSPIKPSLDSPQLPPRNPGHPSGQDLQATLLNLNNNINLRNSTNSINAVTVTKATSPNPSLGRPNESPLKPTSPNIGSTSPNPPKSPNLNPGAGLSSSGSLLSPSSRPPTRLPPPVPPSTTPRGTLSVSTPNLHAAASAPTSPSPQVEVVPEKIVYPYTKYFASIWFASFPSKPDFPAPILPKPEPGQNGEQNSKTEADVRKIDADDEFPSLAGIDSEVRDDPAWTIEKRTNQVMKTLAGLIQGEKKYLDEQLDLQVCRSVRKLPLIEDFRSALLQYALKFFSRFPHLLLI